MSEILRFVDLVHRERDIDRESIFQALETALLSAVRKQEGRAVEVSAIVDRVSGEIEVWVDGKPVDHKTLGRIAAQTAKQILLPRNREAERDVIYKEYEHKKGEMVTGMVQRLERGMVIVNMGRTEGIIPRMEQVRTELYKPGDRVRCLILDVQKVGQQVRIILSRANSDLVRRLFEIEVPEIGERIVEIRALVREPGHRTKIAVASVDSRVDAVGACVGVRGSRIKNVVDELNGEKIDIIRWSDMPEILLGNSLKPAEAEEIYVYAKTRRAEVIVADDQLALAIGRRGQNVRLAGKLCGWQIDVYTREQMRERSAERKAELSSLPHIGEENFGRLAEAGFGGWKDVAERGGEGLSSLAALELTADQIGEIVRAAAERQAAKDAREAEERARAEAETAAATAAQAAASAAAPASADAAQGGPSPAGGQGG